MKAQTPGIITRLPSFPRTKKYSSHLGGALLAALLAAGSAQAQVTGISITGFMDLIASDCATVNVLFTDSGRGIGNYTLEVSQGGNTGTYTFAGRIGGSTGMLLHASISDAPFTVTVTVTDGTNTFSDTKSGSGCTSPTLVSTYTVTPNPATNGSVNCVSPVAQGDTTICTATPELGYTLGDMTVASGSAGPITCNGLICTLPNVQGNVTVSATFTPEYTVSDATPTGAGGTMDCTSPVQHGKGTTCTAKPKLGYVFDKAMDISPAGAAKLDSCDESGCTLTNVTDDVSVEGTFKKEDYNITDASDPAEGSITCTPNPVPYGETVTCTASPAPGYELSGVSSSGGVSWTCDPEALTCTSSPITSALTVRATFTQPQPQQPRVISDTPTLGELGLLLSGLALAGAAAPALRRREKQGKIADTRQ